MAFTNSPATPPVRPATWALVLVLAAGLALRLHYLLKPLDWVVSFFPSDDYFYYLGTAFHLAQGDGSTLDGLTRHNGYQPLFTWLLTGVFRLGATKGAAVQIGLGILSAAGLVASFLAYRVTRLLGGRPGAALAPAVALSLGLYWLKLGLSGFETMLALSLILATVESVLCGRRGWVSGLLLGLAGLARVDSVLLAPGIAVYLLRRDRKRLLEVAAVAGAVCLPWAVWSVASFGSPLPLSGAVKMLFASSAYYQAGIGNLLAAIWSLLAGMDWQALITPLLLAVAGALMLADTARDWRRSGWLLSYPLLLAAAYTTLTDPRPIVQHARYLSPGIMVAALIFFSRRTRLPALWTAALVAAMVFSDRGFHTWAASAPALDTYVGRNQRDVPAILAAIVGPGDLVGAFDNGAAGYFAAVPVVNLDGLANAEIVALLRDESPAGTWEQRYRRYYRERGITIMIGGMAYSWVGQHSDLDTWERLHPPLASDDGGEIVFLRVPR